MDITELTYVDHPAKDDEIKECIGSLMGHNELVDIYKKREDQEGKEKLREAVVMCRKSTDMLCREFLYVKTLIGGKFCVRASKKACKALTAVCCELETLDNLKSCFYNWADSRSEVWESVRDLDHVLWIIKTHYKKFKKSERRKYIINKNNI